MGLIITNKEAEQALEEIIGIISNKLPYGIELLEGYWSPTHEFIGTKQTRLEGYTVLMRQGNRVFGVNYPTGQTMKCPSEDEILKYLDIALDS